MKYDSFKHITTKLVALTRLQFSENLWISGATCAFCFKQNIIMTNLAAKHLNFRLLFDDGTSTHRSVDWCTGTPPALYHHNETTDSSVECFDKNNNSKSSVSKSGLRFSFWATRSTRSESEENATVESEGGLFLTLRSGAMTTLQIYPQLLGNLASETTFDPWKVVFSWGKVGKGALFQKALCYQF